jgi:uncharacterized protein YfeS
MYRLGRYHAIKEIGFDIESRIPEMYRRLNARYKEIKDDEFICFGSGNPVDVVRDLLDSLEKKMMYRRQYDEFE